MPIRIVISGWAAVFEGDRQVTEPDTLRDLDGLVYDDESFTDYLGDTGIEGSLAEALERGGILAFRHVDEVELLNRSSGPFFAVSWPFLGN